jgi:hypothetical protein
LRIDEPGNLYGVHADLIEGTLGRGEKILYLIYSPVWESEKALLDLHNFTAAHWESKKEIFGLSVYPASHAVAVTERRFIISEDRHLEGIPPTVQSIPFDRVISVELGSALLLAWLAIQFVDQDQLSSTALLYTNSSGKDHFHRAILEYRKLFRPIDGHRMLPSRLWAQVWPKASLLQMERLQLLLREAEFPIFLIHSSETWNTVKRGWRRVPVCMKAKSIFVATNFGVLYAVDEPAERPGMLSFGVGIYCFPPEVLKSVVLEEKPFQDKTLPFLRLEAGRNSVKADFEILFDQDSYKSAVNFVQWMASGQSRADLKVVL